VRASLLSWHAVAAVGVSDHPEGARSALAAGSACGDGQPGPRDGPWDPPRAPDQRRARAITPPRAGQPAGLPRHRTGAAHACPATTTLQGNGTLPSARQTDLATREGHSARDRSQLTQTRRTEVTICGG
jgi:hypothetical protein